MGYERQILVILLCYVLSLLLIRSFLLGLKSYQLNRNAYKKRKKGETFKEWLFYNRYRDEIPKSLLILYFCILIIHPICIIACTIIHLLKLPTIISIVISYSVLIGDVLWFVIITLLFWSRKSNRVKYERWITKRRGQKK